MDKIELLSNHNVQLGYKLSDVNDCVITITKGEFFFPSSSFKMNEEALYEIKLKVT
jgi:hypothetical protein